MTENQEASITDSLRFMQQDIQDARKELALVVKWQHPLYRFAAASLAGLNASTPQLRAEAAADLAAGDAIALCKRLGVPLPEGAE